MALWNGRRNLEPAKFVAELIVPLSHLVVFGGWEVRQSLQAIVVFYFDSCVFCVLNQYLQLILKLLWLKVFKHFAKAGAVCVLYSNCDCVCQIEQNVTSFGLWISSKDLKSLCPFLAVGTESNFDVFGQFLCLFDALLSAFDQLLIYSFIKAPVLFDWPHDARTGPCCHLEGQWLLLLAVHELRFILGKPPNEGARIATADEHNFLERVLAVVPKEKRFHVFQRLLRRQISQVIAWQIWHRLRFSVVPVLQRD